MVPLTVLSQPTKLSLADANLDATELGFRHVTGTGAARLSFLTLARTLSLNQLTASAIKVDVLDVNTINSVTTTANDLEVSDRRIVAGSGLLLLMLTLVVLELVVASCRWSRFCSSFDHGNADLD